MSEAGSNITDEMWATTTWEGHHRQQLQEWRRIPFEQKIESIEEMQRVAEMFSRARPLARPIVPPQSEVKK